MVSCNSCRCCVAVAHGRQQLAQMRELLKRLLDGADGERPRIDQLGGVIKLGCDHAGAVWHVAVRECRAVFDHQHAFAGDGVGIGNRHPARRLDDLRCRIDIARYCLRTISIASPVSGVHLVNDEHVCGAEIDFARVIGEFVSRAMRIEHNDVQVGLVERCVVVAAVPQDNVAVAARPSS